MKTTIISSSRFLSFNILALILVNLFSQQQIFAQVAENDLGTVKHEVFLLGNLYSGSVHSQADKVLQSINQQLSSDRDQSVVLLGNSLSATDLVDRSSVNTRLDNLKKSINKLTDHETPLYFIPGNLEWHYKKKANEESRKYVEKTIQHLSDKVKFLPNKACGEIETVKLTDDLIIAFVDSPWLMIGDDSDERNRSGCEVDNIQEWVTNLEDILSSNKHRHVVIATHHPIYSNGHTSGNFTLKDHLIPAPIIGSLITAVKKLGPGEQYFGHPNYERYRTAFKQALSNYDQVVVASAHDKNLQLLTKNNTHFIVAGSTSQNETVAQGGDALFTSARKGFSKIIVNNRSELWVEFYSTATEGEPNAELLYRQLLSSKKEYLPEVETSTFNSLPSTVNVKASERYSNKIFGMGDLYRMAWSTPVQASAIDLKNTHGGLKPVKQGGGFQTKSLRLENKDGTQYVLRTIDKDVSKVVPQDLRSTFVQDLIQDGIAAAHPYAAMAVAPLADAAGIYHANPKFVWLAKQENLGIYNSNFSDRLYLFEERPGGNMTTHPDYGGARESLNTPELIEKLQKNHKHRVDQDHVLRSRLFDIWIGDWDRHDDQWRWGKYEDPENSKVNLYRAIPRDRDQAFFNNNGWINFLASRPYISPQLRRFDSEVDYLPGLVYNARHFDRHFLNMLNRQDFIRTAQSLQEALTDDKIKEGISVWPEEIFNLNGQDIIDKLKVRRSDLVKYAEKYYEHLVRQISVHGTEDSNLFTLSTKSDHLIEVEVYHITDKGKKHKTWSRVIDDRETKELHLYGLSKSDEFILQGEHENKIKIRIIGGSGKDLVINNSKLKVEVYDKNDGMTLEGDNIKSKLSDNRGVNRYDRKDWELDRSIHYPLPSFYTDAGLGISYNVLMTKRGFRDDPFKSTHALSLQYYFNNNAIVAKYNSLYPNAIARDVDLGINVNIVGPAFTQFYYGLNNDYVDYSAEFPDSPTSDAAEFHIVEGVQVNLAPSLRYNISEDKKVVFSPKYRYLDLSEPSNEEMLFINTDAALLTSSDFNTKHYLSTDLSYSITRQNHAAIPTRGFHFNIGGDIKQSISSESFTNLNLHTELKTYIPLNAAHSLVLAMNMGGAYILGEYEFFDANYLSNLNRLRGYRINRFAGDGMLYHASDLRLRLTEGTGALKTGLGLYGSFDYGRVFNDSEQFNDLHLSYGGGVYLTPLQSLGIKLGYHVGQSDRQMIIGGSLNF